MTGSFLPAASGVAAELSSDCAERVLALAESVWAEMGDRGIVPTPRAYDVWFAHRSGVSHSLSDHIDSLIAQGSRLSPAMLDGLHAEFIASADIDLERLGAGADGLEEAAQTLVRHVEVNRASLSIYGDTLSRWVSRLAEVPTVSGLVGAVASLSAETLKASERNHILERQLAASLARISKLRQSLNAAKAEATTDSLTSVTNRRAFDARLRRMAAQARAEPSTAVSVVLLDVDHFKSFNDSYGHRTGDLVLRLVARLLSENVKGRDTVARYGGEEFAILLTGANLQAARTVARQICAAMAAKCLVQKSTQKPIRQITLSAGVAQLRAGENMSSWLERADAALYKAKGGGRNRVCSELDLASALSQAAGNAGSRF